MLPFVSPAVTSPDRFSALFIPLLSSGYAETYGPTWHRCAVFFLACQRLQPQNRPCQRNIKRLALLGGTCNV
jgi:hypothetical protein